MVEKTKIQSLLNAVTAKATKLFAVTNLFSRDLFIWRVDKNLIEWLLLHRLFLQVKKKILNASDEKVPDMTCFISFCKTYCIFAEHSKQLTLGLIFKILKIIRRIQRRLIFAFYEVGRRISNRQQPRWNLPRSLEFVSRL